MNSKIPFQISRLSRKEPTACLGLKLLSPVSLLPFSLFLLPLLLLLAIGPELSPTACLARTFLLPAVVKHKAAMERKQRRN